MATDWKDALGALMASGAVPEDNTPDAGPSGDPTPKKGTLHVSIDRKGRKGKTATIVDGFGENDEEAEKVAKELKRRLGTGGSSRGGEILIQGERRDEVATLLREMGYKVK